MGGSMVDARQGISSKLEIRLETMENNHEELKSMQDTLVQNQTRMSNMLEELLPFMKARGGSKEHRKPNATKLQSPTRSMGMVNTIIVGIVFYSFE
jgi:hypothetical protein